MTVGDTNYANNIGTCRHVQRQHSTAPPTCSATPEPTGRRHAGHDHRRDVEHRHLERVPQELRPQAGHPVRLLHQLRRVLLDGPITPTINGNLYSTLTKLSANCQAATTLSVFQTAGYSWAFHEVGSGGGYTHIQTPNKKSCLFSNRNVDPPTTGVAGLLSASSNHAGGVNVGFLDGSVRFVKNSVNQTTWWSLATKAGGEIIGGDSL